MTALHEETRRGRNEYQERFLERRRHEREEYNAYEEGIRRFYDQPERADGVIGTITLYSAEHSDRMYPEGTHPRRNTSERGRERSRSRSDSSMLSEPMEVN